MQVIPIESRQLTQFENQIREGVIKSYRILEGGSGAGMFSMRLVNIAGKYFSPRHRHNFDQIRYQIAGEFDYDADGCLRPGCAGYFPEGVRYGPQTSSGDTWNVLVQFGGASGSGYTPEREEERGAGELKAKGGKFEKGVFTYIKPDGTKVNHDAYEAIWEHIHGKPLVYPKARYERPVLMNTANYDWLPLSGQPGVCWGCFPNGKRGLSSTALTPAPRLHWKAIVCISFCPEPGSLAATRISSTPPSAPNRKRAARLPQRRLHRSCILGCPVSNSSPGLLP